MMRIKTLQSALLCLSALLLSACGGGGGNGGGTPIVAASPEGVYEGSTSNDLLHTTLVLDDDRFYSIYGEEVNDVFYVTGLLQGNGVARNGSFTSSNLRDYYFDGSVIFGTLSATYTAGQSFNGTLSNASGSATFTGVPLTDSSYTYNAPANLANISGSWTLDSMQGDTISVLIQANGTFAASASGCSFNGTVLPRVSGKNVFDVNFTFGAAPCLLPGQTVNGIALEYQIGTLRQLLIAGTTLDRNFGTVLFGVRGL